MTLPPTGQLTVEPAFAQGSRGNLLLVEHHPDPVLDKSHVVYFFPPFAEEMNKTRRMFALQAQQLAALGYRAVVFDLYGTGDSEGDFADAEWNIWLEDIALLCERYRQRGANAYSVIAARLGAMLAVDYCEQSSTTDRPQQLILWQPCTSGKAYLRQFLRMRLAASLTGDAQTKETAGDLMQRLAQGESLEVAGYELSSALALRIDTLDLTSVKIACLPLVHWFDVAAGDAGTLSVASQKIIDRWREDGADVTALAVSGEPFWSVQEMTIAPRLLSATTVVFSEESPG